VRRLEARGRELERVVRERTQALEERGQELAAANVELSAAYARIEDASLTDPLTGLRNRRFLEQHIPGDAQLALRRSGDARVSAAGDLVFLLIDLDHFKAVNDTHGHAAGDAVLVQTAALLRQALRASDVVVRWGGEEFLAVLRFVDRREAPRLAEKVRAAIAGHAFELGEGLTLRRTCSLGFAAHPLAPGRPEAQAWEQAVHVADRCLYAAKRSGRDRWVGVELVAEDAPAAARFLADAAASVGAGDVRVIATDPANLNWA